MRGASYQNDTAMLFYPWVMIKGPRIYRGMLRPVKNLCYKSTKNLCNKRKNI